MSFKRNMSMYTARHKRRILQQNIEKDLWNITRMSADVLRHAQVLEEKANLSPVNNITATSTKDMENTLYHSDEALSSIHHNEDVNSDEGEANEEQPKDQTLNSLLKAWAFEHNISRVAFSALLNILAQYNTNVELPKDSRTLLKTPRRVSGITPCNPGLYGDFGLANILNKFCNFYVKMPEYYVILSEDGLVVIPYNWLLPQGDTFYWPKRLNKSKLLNAVKNKLPPVADSPHWDICPIEKICGFADTYERAEEKLIKCQYKSDTDTGASSPDISIHRKRKHGTTTKILTPQLLDETEEEEDIDFIFEEPSSSLQGHKTTVISGMTIPKLPSQQETMQASCSGTNIDNRVFQKDILNKMNILNQELHIIKEYVMHTSENQNTLTTQADSKDIPCRPLPVNTICDLNALNNDLKDATFFQAMVCRCSRLGGQNEANVIVNVLKHLITDSVAVQYSMYGKKSKLALHDLDVLKLIIETVRVRFKHITDHSIRTTISKWLVQAQQRLNRKGSEY